MERLVLHRVSSEVEELLNKPDSGEIAALANRLQH